MTKTGWRSAARLMVAMAAVLPVVSGCSLGGFGGTGATVKRGIFSSSEYGVKASPRVSSSSHPRRGGGRYLVGKPYTVRGQVYVPREDPTYQASGTTSWYGSDFHGRLTANGEIFSANAITGAHPTLPIPSYVRVTNLDNGRSFTVRINDRGPYTSGRVIDLSHRAAQLLGYVNRGMTNVSVQYVAPAPLEGDDTKMLVASLDAPYGIDNDVRTAMAEERPNLLSSIFGMFSYADGTPMDAQKEDAAIVSAHDAASAMATHSGALESWAASVDENSRSLKLELGVFTDPDKALDVATAFALLGAVDEKQVDANGRPATLLTLIKLKPGVARADVSAMSSQLGLERPRSML